MIDLIRNNDHFIHKEQQIGEPVTKQAKHDTVAINRRYFVLDIAQLRPDP